MSDPSHGGTLDQIDPRLKLLAQQQHRLSFRLAGLFCLSFFLYGAVSVYQPALLAARIDSSSSLTFAVVVSFSLITSYVAGAIFYLYIMNNKLEKLKALTSDGTRS